jgi:hypothetical protein
MEINFGLFNHPRPPQGGIWFIPAPIFVRGNSPLEGIKGVNFANTSSYLQCYLFLNIRRNVIKIRQRRDTIQPSAKYSAYL